MADISISTLSKEIELFKKEDARTLKILARSIDNDQAWQEIMKNLKRKYIFTDEEFYNGGNKHTLVDLRSAAINAASLFLDWGPTTISLHIKQNHATCIHHTQRHETRLKKRWEYAAMWSHMQILNKREIIKLPQTDLEAYINKLKNHRDFLNNRIDELTSLIVDSKVK